VLKNGALNGVNPVEVWVQSLALAGRSTATIVRVAAKILRMRITNSLSHGSRVQRFLY
jgi:hypothetical protein